MLTDCLTCQSFDHCDQWDRWHSGCINHKMMPTKNPTNADRIRGMTDEELADWICDQIIDRNIGIPPETWLDWLKQEVDDGNKKSMR